MGPESRRAGEPEREAAPAPPHPSSLTPHPSPRTGHRAPVVIIHNSGGGNTPEQAAEDEIQESLEAVEGSLAALGRPFWRLTLEPPLSEAARLLEAISGATTVFNLFEGFPDDPPSEVQVGLLLKASGLRATGCPPLSMHAGLYKDFCKELLSSRGLPATPGLTARFVTDLNRPPPFPFPVFLKPAADDASHGVGPENLVPDGAELRSRGAVLLDRFPAGILVEPFLCGREFNCGVLEIGGVPVALPPSQVDYSALPSDYPPVLTFAAKWQPGHPAFDLTPTICPAPVGQALIGRIRSLATEAFLALRCRGYARVDFREDGEGALRILEVNPNPDLSPSAGLAKQARAIGWDYTDLVAAVLSAAEEGLPWTY